MRKSAPAWPNGNVSPQHLARPLLGALYDAGVAAVQPARLIDRYACVADARWHYDAPDHTFSFALPASSGRIRVCGAGKAVVPFADALLRSLGERSVQALVVTKHGHAPAPVDPRIEVLTAGHPVPDVDGERAALRMEAFIDQTGPGDLLIVLLTGGASALLPAPVAGITLSDKQAVTRDLLRCGATINEINVVRKHLSRLKGGGMARRADGARIVSLTLSDVLGDDPAIIGSGPTVADSSTYADCRSVLARYSIWATIPDRVRRHIEAGLSGGVPETVKPGASCLDRTQFHLLAGLSQALAAVQAEAEARGVRVHRLETPLQGDAGHCVERLVAAAMQLSSSAERPWLLLSGGEPTVVVTGEGRGGRNQHLALLLVLALDGAKGISALVAGTDGTDGPTDAAGAWVLPDTLARADALGLDAEQHATCFDAYPFFAALGDLHMTGPTGTNVTDLVLVLGA